MEAAQKAVAESSAEDKEKTRRAIALAEKVILESEIGNEKTRIFEQLESNRKRQEGSERK